MKKAQLLKKIRSFRYWHYPFDLGNGILIKPTHSYYAREKIELRNFIWPAALSLCGGNLKGLRVLDVGCNAGFWCLEAHRSGAAYVLGIDPRTVHIEQAQLIQNALGISTRQLEFRHKSVYDLSRRDIGKFDLCLMLRVLQHLSDPLFALKQDTGGLPKLFGPRCQNVSCRLAGPLLDGREPGGFASRNHYLGV